MTDSETTFHLVQTSLHWEDAQKNLEVLQEKIAPLAQGVVILPEMFSTGFSMASQKLAEPMSGPTVAWLKERAALSGNTHCGSVIIKDGGHYYNRFLWVRPDGDIDTYDKRHLFRMADEHAHYSPGNERRLLQAGELKVMPQVCYDLRFPAWSRNADAEKPYDVLLYVANWPAARREHWLALLRARAIENLCYVIGVNRVGIDGNGIAYTGDSCVMDFRGDTLLALDDADTVQSIALDKMALEQYRRSFPAHLDADRFQFDAS